MARKKKGQETTPGTKIDPDAIRSEEKRQSLLSDAQTKGLPADLSPKQIRDVFADKAAGQDFIGQREKLINRGFNKRDAAIIAAQAQQDTSFNQVNLAQAQAAGQARKDIAGNIGNIPAEDVGLNPLISGETIAGALATGVATAGAGAAAGAFGGPVGIGAGAVGGFVAGVSSGIVAKLISEARQGVKEDLRTFTEARDGMDSIIKELEAGHIDSATAVNLYNRELQKISRSERKLKLETKSDLRKFLGDPGDELIQIQSFNDLERGFFDAKLAAAVANSPI